MKTCDRVILGVCLAAVVAALLTSCKSPLPADRVYLYLVNIEPDELVVVDPLVKEDILARFNVGANLRSIAVLPDGKTAYIASEVTGFLTKFDLEHARVLKNYNIKGFPQKIVPHPTQPFLYMIVGDPEAVETKEITVLNTDTREITTKIPVRDLLKDIKISPDGRWLYAVSAKSTTVFAIDTESNRVDPAHSFELSHTSSAFDISPDGTFLVFTFNLSDVLEIVDAETGKSVRSLKVGSLPAYVAISPDGKLAYVANMRSQDVDIVDLTTYQMSGTIHFETTPVLLRPATKYLYVGVQNGFLFVADPATKEIIKKINLRSTPVDMAIRFPEKG
ncbi:MAG: beta-propeller fold lactonase family protein [bacterium]